MNTFVKLTVYTLHVFAQKMQCSVDIRIVWHHNRDVAVNCYWGGGHNSKTSGVGATLGRDLLREKRDNLE